MQVNERVCLDWRARTEAENHIFIKNKISTHRYNTERDAECMRSTETRQSAYGFSVSACAFSAAEAGPMASLRT